MSSVPVSSLVPIIAAAIVPLGGRRPGPRRRARALLAVITGAIVLAAGIACSAFLTQLLSAPVRHGYLNGIALIVIIGQLPKLFGFSVDADGLLAEFCAFAEGVAGGETNPTALAIGLVLLAVSDLLQAAALNPFPGSSSRRRLDLGVGAVLDRDPDPDRRHRRRFP